MRDPGPLSREREAETTEKRPRYGVIARASAAGILFPLSIVAGYLLGKWIGAALGLGEAPAFIGAAFGVAAGFWNLYRLVRGIEGSGDRR